MSHFAIKIEDYHSHFDLAPWVNYQGDRYMGKDGATYLFIDNPDVVDVHRFEKTSAKGCHEWSSSQYRANKTTTHTNE